MCVNGNLWFCLSTAEAEGAGKGFGIIGLISGQPKSAVDEAEATKGDEENRAVVWYDDCLQLCNNSMCVLGR